MEALLLPRVVILVTGPVLGGSRCFALHLWTEVASALRFEVVLSAVHRACLRGHCPVVTSGRARCSQRRGQLTPWFGPAFSVSSDDTPGGP